MDVLANPGHLAARTLLAVCLAASGIRSLRGNDEAAAPVPLSSASTLPLGLGIIAAVDGDAADAHWEELLLETRVNGLPPVVTLLALRDPRGRLWIAADAFAWWDMLPPEGETVDHQGRAFHPLDGQPGLGYTLDPSRLTLEIQATAPWFTRNRVDGGAHARTAPPEASPGAFFNYDVNVGHSGSDTFSSGLFEIGAFNGWGVAISDFLVRHGGANLDEGLVRLQTTWTLDLPEQRASLRVGDAVGFPGGWGRAVRFGGVQWATNFATQPGFITFPLPSLNGETALPSTLELYVNGMRRMSSEVPPGPFSIPDLPTITGQGEVQLVVRDLLGREQIITDRFYASTRLLRTGLHEFSYEVGSEREAFGLESFDYGDAFAAGTHRVGLSDTFTLEARGEARSGQYTAGVGGALLLGRFGVLHGALAGSHGERGEGGLLRLGFEHSSRHLGLGFNLQLASEEFTQLGLREDELPPRTIGQAWLSLPLQRAGSLSFSYTLRDERPAETWPDRGRFESLGASYQVSLGDIGYLSVSVNRVQAEEDDTLVAVHFTRPLGTRTTSSASASFSGGSDQLALQVQRSLPVGTGFGYRARAGLLDQERFDAGLSAQNDYGTLQIDAGYADDATGLRASASGGLALLGGDVHLARRMDSSFAVVQVGDFEGVRVYADNQHVATTDENGRALLPRLRAYEENPLRIEVGDLPIDAKVGQVDRQAVPYFRSGLVVNFDVSRSRNAVFRLLRADGTPVPAGSMIAAPGGERFPVGYDGQAFVTGLDTGAALEARWNGTVCAFELILPEGEDPMPDLGVITCRESHR
jgi:outer membrane usher protein